MKDFIIEGRTLTAYTGNDEIAEIPKSVFAIRRGAFAGNTDIKEVVIPLNTRIIEAEAFKGCTNLKKVTLLGAEIIGAEAFMNTAVEEVDLPETIIKASASAFSESVQVNFPANSLFMEAPKLSVSNSKLGVIPTLDLPPITTCRRDAPCMNECYACRSHYVYLNHRVDRVINLKAYYANPQFYFDSIVAQISRGLISYNFFRWHSTGDIPDIDYLDGMAKVARKVKGTRFLCFTKKYELVNKWLETHKKPTNLILIFSNWGGWLCDNPHNLPTAWIEFKNRQTMIPAKAFRCPGSCSACAMANNGSCWYMKKGDCVVFEEHSTTIKKK